jgi:hypothetical protein
MTVHPPRQIIHPPRQRRGDSSAQGNALGTRPTQLISALKGQNSAKNNIQISRPAFGPYRALVWGSGRVPRALPWADELQPFGLSHWAGSLGWTLGWNLGEALGWTLDWTLRATRCVSSSHGHPDRPFEVLSGLANRTAASPPTFLNAKLPSKSKVSRLRPLPTCTRPSEC